MQLDVLAETKGKGLNSFIINSKPVCSELKRLKYLRR